MSDISEAMLYLDAAQVASLCRAIDPVAVVTKAFTAVSDGHAEVAPEAALRWMASDGTSARSLILPARYEQAYGCKIINSCIGNIGRGRPRASGLILLFDPQTAVPVCLLHGSLISALRTAAVSLAALQATRDLGTIDRITFLGCGYQARTHAELFAARFSPKEVVAHDTVLPRAKSFEQDIRSLLPDAVVRVAATAREAVPGGDVVVAATTTTTPYVALDWLSPGAVFLNVSLDDATEEVLLGCDRLFVDDWKLVSDDDTRLLGRLVRAGRVTGPGEPAPDRGRAVDAELAALFAGNFAGTITGTDRVVVNPFGMGVHDVALAARIYEAALADGAGTWLPR